MEKKKVCQYCYTMFYSLMLHSVSFDSMNEATSTIIIKYYSYWKYNFVEFITSRDSHITYSRGNQFWYISEYLPWMVSLSFQFKVAFLQNIYRACVYNFSKSMVCLVRKHLSSKASSYICTMALWSSPCWVSPFSLTHVTWIFLYTVEDYRKSFEKHTKTNCRL